MIQENALITPAEFGINPINNIVVSQDPPDAAYDTQMNADIEEDKGTLDMDKK